MSGEVIFWWEINVSAFSFRNCLDYTVISLLKGHPFCNEKVVL